MSHVQSLNATCCKVHELHIGNFARFMGIGVKWFFVFTSDNSPPCKVTVVMCEEEVVVVVMGGMMVMVAALQGER